MKKSLIVIAILAVAAVLAFAGPADGVWNIQVAASGAAGQILLNSSGTNLTGTMDGIAISGGTVEGATVRFQATRNSVAYTYKGTVTNGKLSLYESPAGAKGRLLIYIHPGN
ncbi:MAG TPA: hypothetical protein VG456_06105 [Candidatus Sulfopaludibacter sp.]|nr:hypothetical protein [Candidatus Sulfopaludibacter sp.]